MGIYHRVAKRKKTHDPESSGKYYAPGNKRYSSVMGTNISQHPCPSFSYNTKVYTCSLQILTLYYIIIELVPNISLKRIQKSL